MQSTDHQSATDWVALAFFCEHYSLNNDAYQAYRRAHQIDPENLEYRQLMAKFLDKVKMNETLASR